MQDTKAHPLRGAAAGFFATVPMTAVMLSLHRQLPIPQQRRPVQPRQIVEQAAEQVHVRDEIPPEQRQEITYIAHFGYGSAAGAVYGILNPLLPGPPVVRGIGFALGVWAFGYLGWLPLLGLYPPATREPAGRNFNNLASHITWGASLGLAYERL